MGLLDLLEVGTVFDWISPTLSIAQDIANGPSYTFLIPTACGRTGREIANLLRARGIKTWGHMIVNGHFMITVGKNQAQYAGYLLSKQGIPVPGGESDDNTLHGLLTSIGRVRL